MINIYLLLNLCPLTDCSIFVAAQQEQVVISKVGVQRSGRLREQEAKANLLNNNKEESNSIGAKRKTRATAGKNAN